MKKLSTFILASAFFITPLLAFAQEITDVEGVAKKATSIGNLTIALAISLAVIWIIISVIRYLIVSSEPTARKEGGMRILYGVVGLFVILSIWGFVYILKKTFETRDETPNDTIIRATRLPLDPQTPNQSGNGVQPSQSNFSDPFDHRNVIQ